MQILVVDSDHESRCALAETLTAMGHDVLEVEDGRKTLAACAREDIGLVFAAQSLPKLDGMSLLERIKADRLTDTRVVLMDRSPDLPVVVRAMKIGASDFLAQPIGDDDLRRVIAGVEAERRSDSAGRDAMRARSDVDATVVGSSEAMARVKRLVRIAARTDANVLIYGETGVGKDLLAGVIHRISHRRRAPFVKVGFTLLPPQLIEAELYGHEEGAFTGAGHAKPGRFELAEGGTIYLDDVDDIPLDQQAKLLRAIEEKAYERVGGTRVRHADVRIVASTKRNLLAQIGRGVFREDLYYRLDVLRIHVPPLRQRPEDIPELATHLMRRIADGKPHRVDPEAVELLTRQPWPGNIRQLYHALERAYLVGGGHVTVEMLEGETQTAAPPAPPTPPATPTSAPSPNSKASAPASPPLGGFHTVIRHAEKQLLVDALDATGGNKTAAAKSLGIKPSTFRDKLAKYGLR